MDIQKVKDIKERIWFWKENDEWPLKDVRSPKHYDEIQKRLKDIIDQKVKASYPISYIFLVDTPITFGHSQLVMKFALEACPNESARFNRAALIIEKALSTFKQVLNSKTINEYAKLAEFTLTKKCYVKTLILRVSAQEDRGKEYKVHLVPYFKSHASACRKRYTAIHSVNRKERGGLLGWLGERETLVESWKNESVNLRKEKLDEILNNVWKLPELAKLLAGS